MSDSAAVTAPPRPVPDRRRGWLLRWYAADPVRAAAIGLILVHLVVRVQVAAGGYLAQDDFALVTRAHDPDLWPGLTPVPMLVTARVGLSYPPYLAVMLAGQALLAVAFCRLLRLVLPSTWGVLIPLVVFLFSPLTLEAGAWWAVGGTQVGLLLAMALALAAQVHYTRTGRARHLVALGGSVVLGLLFTERALLIAPLVLVFTTCLLGEGGPVEALRRFWRAWLVLGVLVGGYLTLSAALAPAMPFAAASRPEHTGTFVREIVGSTLLPGLFGGPWEWLGSGDGPPLTATPEPLRWASWIAFLALVVVTASRRRVAVRAWLLLALYLAMTVALMAVGRLPGAAGPDTGADPGLEPRHVTDVVLVAALCIGVAVFGLARDRTQDRPRDRPSDRTTATVTAALVVLVVSAGWTSARFGDLWTHKVGRAYLDTVRAQLADVPRDMVFFDAPVPTAVMPARTAPYNLQSHLFAHINPGPQFVAAAEEPRMFDDTGHIRPARIDGSVVNRPGPEPDCGYKATEGGTARVELTSGVPDRQWAIRIAYLSGGEAPAVVYFGGTAMRFQVHHGVGQILLIVRGGGEYLDLKVLDPTVTACTNEVTVGTARPLP